MRSFTRFAVIALGVATLVAAATAAGGCGSGGGQARSQWERVVSAKVSGEKPIKVNLGDHQLGDRLRVAWTLTGPEDPPVTLTLRIFDVKTGRGYGTVVTSESGAAAIARQDDQAMSLVLIPAEYRIYFSQRFPPSRGPGYDITMTIWTMHTYAASPAP
jgi:hypothetical protein